MTNGRPGYADEDGGWTSQSRSSSAVGNEFSCVPAVAQLSWADGRTARRLGPTWGGTTACRASGHQRPASGSKGGRRTARAGPSVALPSTAPTRAAARASNGDGEASALQQLSASRSPIPTWSREGNLPGRGKRGLRLAGESDAEQPGCSVGALLHFCRPVGPAARPVLVPGSERKGGLLFVLHFCSSDV
jgi:hypothetical protein